MDIDEARTVKKYSKDLKSQAFSTSKIVHWFAV
jgi:hypothetical protein